MQRLQKQILVVANDVGCDLAIEVARSIASQYPEHIVREMIAGGGAADSKLHMATYRYDTIIVTIFGDFRTH
jgi:hypothetical protein